jgi:hypothetical protein
MSGVSAPVQNTNAPITQGVENSQENVASGNAGAQQSINLTNSMTEANSEVSQANFNRGVSDMMNAANMAAVESMGMIF